MVAESIVLSCYTCFDVVVVVVVIVVVVVVVGGGGGAAVSYTHLTLPTNREV